MLTYKCKRCEHIWYPRSDKAPKACPKCKSPYWNAELTRGMTTTEKIAKNWLIVKYGYNDLYFQKNKSPDFIAPDGKGFEIKTLQGYTLNINWSQWESLKNYENECTILIFDSDEIPKMSIKVSQIKEPETIIDNYKIRILSDPLEKYHRHLELLARVRGRGLKGKVFWEEYHRLKNMNEDEKAKSEVIINDSQ